jgi:hypothetical protein
MAAEVFPWFPCLLASSIAKIGSDPLKLVNDAVEETTDWIYGFFSLLSDIISSEGDEDDEDADEDIDKGTKSAKFYLSYIEFYTVVSNSYDRVLDTLDTDLLRVQT